MTRWKQRYDSKCPFCNTKEEDTLHILCCKDDESMDIWKEMMSTLLKRLYNADTCWLVMLAIRTELNNWKRHTGTHRLTMYPLLLQEAILDQRHLGWKNFLEGFVSKKWSEYMQQYYIENNTRKSSIKWTAKLISNTWKGVHFIWVERCKKMHDTKVIHDLQGLPHLVDSIKKELRIGIGRLPATEFSRQFNKKPEKILECTVEQQISWLQIVRQGRILLDPDNLIDDEVSRSEALQHWIGIDYAINDKEGDILLCQAIETEEKNGLNNLPNSYKNYFKNIDKLLNDKNIKKRKKWLIEIREGRRRYDGDYYLEDEFMHQGAYRDWIMETQ